MSLLLGGLFSSCGKHAYSLVAVHELPVVVRGFSFCGARALGTQPLVVTVCRLNSWHSWALGHRLNRCGTGP